MKRMKRKDLSKEARAWEDFKFISFNSMMIAFGLGALTIIFIRDFIPIMLTILVGPICFFIAWHFLSKKFLKENIIP